jgi:diguanylate cyclase (GGDEF)-like protein/hemerythrin-like metal-binding protein
LADRLGQEMRATRRDGQTFGVLMVDLDGFKAVNDTWGHGAGDAVLLVLAQRFVASMRASDTLARLGGDEFGVLLPRLRNPVDAEIVAARLLLDARRPIEVAGHEIRIGASVGIALYPDHGGTADAVVAAADGALYRAKREGRGRYVWAMTGCQPESSSLPLIVWSAAHEVGIEVIDSQHAYLAAAINDLADALRNGHLGEDTLGKLAEVIRLAEFHFATEERLMAQHGFEGSASHRRAHDRLLTDLRAMAVDRDFRSVTLVTRYLQGWLLRHVDGMDAELSQSLRDRGVR